MDQIEIVLEKSEKFDSLMNASNAAAQAAPANDKVVANGEAENKN